MTAKFKKNKIAFIFLACIHLQRHRMVNENLSTELQGTIHALSIVVSKCFIYIFKEIH